jgi:glucokinase
LNSSTLFIFWEIVEQILVGSESAVIETVAQVTSGSVFAADLGGTNLRAAIVEECGKLSFRVKHPTPHNTKNPEEILQALVKAARECEGSVLQAGGSIRAASVVVPGTIDIGGQAVVQAPNLPSLDGFGLTSALSEQLGWPVLIENDANAAAVGEMWLGAARGAKSVICVTLGTGVGGGIILDGKLWRGVDGSAGEVGHTTVDPFGGVRCKCGNIGCLEQFASATGIVRMAREEMPDHPDSILKADQLSAERIYEAGIQGDKLALKVLERMGMYLGTGLANLVNLLNPEMIVIGGGVANGWELFEKSMRAEVERRAFPVPAGRVKIVPARCGDDAGLLGATHLVLCGR